MSTVLEHSDINPASAAQLLPWAKIFLDYTDSIISNLPESDADLDWRPTDDKGGWYFSIREQAMHIVDERHDALGWITGEQDDEKLFLKEYGGTEKPWEFKPASREQIVESLQAGRAALDDLLSGPPESLLETTDSLRRQHNEYIAKLREGGKEDEAKKREERGPGRIINTVLFIIAHEQAHRAVLQTMLRQRGHDVARMA
jgi:uncharacterized damage-inducible protein DinB